MDISLAYLGHILGISWAYLRHMLGISWAYLRHISKTCPLCHVHCCRSHCCSHLLGFDSFDLDSLQRQHLNLSPQSLSRRCVRLPQKKLFLAAVEEGIVSRGHLLRRSRAPELCGLDFGTMWSRLNFLLQALHIQEGTCC